MADIIKMYPETDDKRIIYKMTATKSLAVKDLEPYEVFTPVRYCLYNEVNRKGEENEILSILDESGTVIATISETFKRDFFSIADLMGGDEFSIKIIHGTTKAGRDFVTCEMVC